MMNNTRIWATVLMLSLMLNAFGLGLLVSHRFTAAKDDRPDFGNRQTEAIHHSSATRHKIAALFREQREAGKHDFAPLMRAIHSARKQAQDALSKSPYDADELEVALRTLREAEQAAAAQAHAVVLKVASQLNDEERAKLGKRIRYERRRGPGPNMPPFNPDADPGHIQK